MANIGKSDRILVTGSEGLLGHAVVRELGEAGYTDVHAWSRATVDLTDQPTTWAKLRQLKPSAVIHCAALVGGIRANTTRAGEFLHQNIAVQDNVIHGSHLADVQTLMFFGSNCMYPTSAPQPLREASLLQGSMEPSNLAYGTAKAAGLVQCQSYHAQFGRNYFTVIPASLYGPHDNYDLEQAHMNPALLRRFHEAKVAGDRQFTVWGTGKPRRELLFVGDAAKGVRLLLESWHASKGAVNLGAGDDLSVAEIARTIQAVVDFKGDLLFDTSKPDGSARKLLDSAQVQALGFRANTSLHEGLAATYKWLTTAPTVRGYRR